MRQQEQVPPGEQASPASSGLAESEANIHRATDLVAQLARVKPRDDDGLVEYNATRYEASKDLIELGIDSSRFGTLVISFNHGGAASIRGFLERHFSSWRGKSGQIQS